MFEGLGLELAKLLYNSGSTLTVIMASRNATKCLEWIDEMKSQKTSSSVTLDWQVLDTSDMDSVKAFSSWFRGKYSHLNILVNNAGIHYMTSAANEIRQSKQGYDLSFATNYFGHFYLTEELLPMMTQEQSRIINVASSYHFVADGHMVTVGTNNTPPLFSQVGNSEKYAYPTSKLAQILHTKELQRRLESKGVNILNIHYYCDILIFSSVNICSAGIHNIKCLSLCPGFVKTNILPHNGFLGAVLNVFAFSVDEGMVVFKLALSSKDLVGGEFLLNMRIFPFSYLPKFVLETTMSVALSLEGIVQTLFFSAFSGAILLMQRANFEPHVGWSSSASMNETLAAQLFDWSRSELVDAGYLA